MSTAVEPTLDLKLLIPADWRMVQAARLQALDDSPEAFALYKEEAQRSQPEFERMCDDGTWIVAQEASDVIGLARTTFDPRQPAIRHIESIWVAPHRRRRGVFRAMLRAIREAEEGRGVTDLFLWVLEDNEVARKVYEAVGFEQTDCKFLPAVGRNEIQLKLNIRAPHSERGVTHSAGWQNQGS